MFTPASIFGMWLRGLFSILIIAGGIYLLYQWQDELPRTSIVAANPELGTNEEIRVLPTFVDRLKAWNPGWDQTTAFLAGGLLLCVWSMTGSWIYPRPFRAAGDYDLNSQRRGDVTHLTRPDGTKLHVECRGPVDAHRMILTHGWGCDADMWHYVQLHFSNRYRIVTWDLPGLGHSTEPQNNDYSLEKMATDLRAVLQATGNQPAILVGHSIGGMATLTLCKMFPELLRNPVAGIAIVHSTYTNPLKTTRFASLLTALQKPLVEPLTWLTIALSPLVWVMNCLSYINGSAHRSTDRQSFAGTETKGQLDFAARYMVKASPRVIARGMLGMLDYDVTTSLDAITVPAWIVVGDRDGITKPAAGEYINSQIPLADLISLAPAKHLGFFEHHDQFNLSLQQFAESTFASFSTPLVVPASKAADDLPIHR